MKMTTNMNTFPIVTLYIPNWNGEERLHFMLDSLLSQTYEDWKAVIVDDQSTDNSFAILQDYAQKDSRIEVYKRDRQPKGAQTCRNMAFEFTVGSKYVICIDSDDVLAPYFIQQRVEFMEQHPELDFGVFPAKTYQDDLNEMPSHLYGLEKNKDELRLFVLGVLPFVVWNNIYRRDSLIGAGLTWDESIRSLQDSDYNIQAILRGLRFGYCTTAKIDYFYFASSKTNSISKKIYTPEHLDSHLFFINKLLSSLSKEQLKCYEIELEARMMRFVDFFRSDRSKLKEMLKIGFIRQNSYLRFRLWFYSFLPARRKIRLILFPELERIRMNAANALAMRSLAEYRNRVAQ